MVVPFGSLPGYALPGGKNWALLPGQRKCLMGHRGLLGRWLKLGLTLPVGPAATSWAPYPPWPGIGYSLVAKKTQEGGMREGECLEIPRIMRISFSSAFPVLNPPRTVATESSQEPVHCLLGRGVKLSRVTNGKRRNIYQVPAMHGHCFRFLCRLYLIYTCPYLADEKTEDLRGETRWDNKATRWSQGLNPGLAFKSTCCVLLQDASRWLLGIQKLWNSRSCASFLVGPGQAALEVNCVPLGPPPPSVRA